MATTEPHRIGGRYELGAVLGYGGMSEVYAARDIRLDRDVAVKVLRADLARDPSFVSRFRREAQSAASLSHPNIVSVYDTGEDTLGNENGLEIPYIVMEHVSGRTLREVLTEEGRLLPRRAMEITAEVAAALEYSHRAGIVHRDIKPGNVMLTRNGEVKVMDFGIARAAATGSADMTQTAQVLGTAQYLSPEQARGEHVDARSDIYSTGCLLYELLTGVPPFQGDSPVAVAYQHVREDPLPPSRVDPDLPASVDAVVLKAMAKNPANRYQTAAEMREDLERAAAGRRVEAPPVLHQDATTALPAAAPTTVLLTHDETDRGRRRQGAYVVLGLAVLAVFIIAALIAKGFFSGTSGSVHAPNVIGMSQEDAQKTLEAQGLHVGDVKTNPIGTDGNTQKQGLVYAQSPPPNATLKKNGAVDLRISGGTAKATVPNVVTLNQSDANAAIQNAGLIVGTVTMSDAVGTPGTVLSQSPEAGKSVDAKSPVNITVVSGQQTVPNVVGKTQGEAQQILKAQGFNVVIKMVADTMPAQTVIAQDQAPNTKIANGSTVTITVSSGPATPSPTPTPTTSTTATPKP